MLKKSAKKAKKIVSKSETKAKPKSSPPAEPAPLTLEQLFDKHRDGPANGRPTELTLYTFRESIRLVSSGIPETMVGPSLKPPLSRNCVNDWKAKGRADAKSGVRSIFSEFSESLREADTLSEDSHLAYIVAARPKDWRASVQLLKWKNPRKYSDKYLLPPPTTTATTPASASSQAFTITPEERAAKLDKLRGVLKAADLLDELRTTASKKRN